MLARASYQENATELVHLALQVSGVFVFVCVCVHVCDCAVCVYISEAWGQPGLQGGLSSVFMNGRHANVDI